MVDEALVKNVVLRTLRASLELQLLAVGELLDEPGATVARPRRRGRRRQSLVDQSIQILTAQGRPLHVNELVDALREQFGRITNRDSVSSALAKKARAGLLVRQVGPASFALGDDPAKEG